MLAQRWRQLGGLSRGPVELHRSFDELELPVFGVLQRGGELVRKDLRVVNNLVQRLDGRPQAPSLVQERSPLVPRQLHESVGDDPK